MSWSVGSQKIHEPVLDAFLLLPLPSLGSRLVLQLGPFVETHRLWFWGSEAEGLAEGAESFQFGLVVARRVEVL